MLVLREGMVLRFQLASKPRCLKKHIIFSYISLSDLVGGFNPVEKYARQFGSFPQFSG